MGRTVTPRVAVLISTYNRPAALEAVLASLAEQVYPRLEVVVADDGSGPETKEVVERFAAGAHFPVRHVWQEDRGYRLAAIRNRAVAATDAEYLIHTDGDCVVRPDFVARHARLAERGWFVRGSRIRLGRSLSEDALRGRLPIHRWRALRWLRHRGRGELDRFSPLLRLPLGPFRKVAPRKWDGAKACNLAVWREDYLAVDGFDEAYEGWGSEDTDFVVRLIRHGIRRKDGRYAVPVLHLWHEQRERVPENRRRFEERLASEIIRAELGVSRYL